MASQDTRSIKAILAGNIRRARGAKGLTQSQLALKVGVESMAVSRWERAIVRPSDANMHALSDALDLDYADFFVSTEEAAA